MIIRSKPNALIISLVSAVLVLSTSYMYASLSPIKTTKAVIIDNDRTIVFQGMTHVGKSSFYNHVRGELINYKSLDYSWLYEGIQLPSESNHNPSLALDCPLLRNKNYRLQPSFSEQININTDTNIDSDFDVSAIEDSFFTSTIPDFCNNMSIVDVRLAYRLNQLKDILGINEGLTNQTEIIDKRNKLLANSTMQTNGNVVIHFGELHLNGFLEELKKQQPGIKVSSVTYHPAF